MLAKNVTSTYLGNHKVQSTYKYLLAMSLAELEYTCR